MALKLRALPLFSRLLMRGTWRLSKPLMFESPRQYFPAWVEPFIEWYWRWWWDG